MDNQINVMNRWQYQDLKKGWVSFINVRFLNDAKQLGQTDFDPLTDTFTFNSPVLSEVEEPVLSGVEVALRNEKKSKKDKKSAIPACLTDGRQVLAN